MKLTREMLLARRGRFAGERDELLSQANARIGMIAELDALLTLMEAPEPPAVAGGTKPSSGPGKPESG